MSRSIRMFREVIDIVTDSLSYTDDIEAFCNLITLFEQYDYEIDYAYNDYVKIATLRLHPDWADNDCFKENGND